jgi:hypothetical protein
MKVILDNTDLGRIFDDAVERFKSNAPLPGIRPELQMVTLVLLSYHDFLAKNGWAVPLEIPTIKPYDGPLED